MTIAAAYAYALDIRTLDTGALKGVALVVPSERRIHVMVDGVGVPAVSNVSEEMWRDIDAWVADGNARLPKRPAPLAPAIVAAFMGAQALDVSAQRFAAIPIAEGFHGDQARLAASLQGLLHVRRSAA